MFHPMNDRWLLYHLQLPVVTPKGELAPPEFGFSTSSAPTGGPREAPLTWEAMRQVGAGFWLTDHQVLLSLTDIAQSLNIMVTLLNVY